MAPNTVNHAPPDEALEEWSAEDALRLLAGAAQHLLTDHDCDRHGYEAVQACVDRVPSIASRLRAREEAVGRLCAAAEALQTLGIAGSTWTELREALAAVRTGA